MQKKVVEEEEKEAKTKGYPKVRVKEQEDKYDQPTFLDSFSTGMKLDSISAHSIAKVPKSYVPNLAMPRISVNKEKKKQSDGDGKQNTDNHNKNCEEDGNQNIDNGEKSEEDGKQNIRASSIPRPRAVLSSPDNDLVIGNKNRSKVERTSVLKNRNSIPKRHELCKVLPRKTAEEDSSSDTKRPKEDAKGSSIKGRKGSEVATPTPRRHLKTGKPGPVRI